MIASEAAARQEIWSALAKMANFVGHELRNPLAVIQNGLYLIEMMLPDAAPDVSETLNLLSMEVDEAARIINSLLDFGRPRILKPQEIDLNELVTHVLAQVTVPPQIEIRAELASVLPEVAVDIEQMILAIGKLVDNAVKAWPADGQPEYGRITLSTSVVSDMVVLAVADTGAGIPDAHLDRIFEPFFTTRAKSIGLGLSVAYAVIDAHGGTIEVSSCVGEGTTFTVRLPLPSHDG